jgi:hypothetical protein
MIGKRSSDKPPWDAAAQNIKDCIGDLAHRPEQLMSPSCRERRRGAITAHSASVRSVSYRD